MSVQPPSESPTLRAHKRQLVWQILLPVLLMAVVGFAAGFFTLRSGTGPDRLLADVAVIWLIAPFLMLGLLITVLLGFVIFGLSRLSRVTPEYTGRLQELAGRLAGGTMKSADTAVRPILWIHQAAAVIQHFVSMLFSG
jgi:hypothetical protein